MLVVPITLFIGILFQLIVFIFVFGNGVSCCGINFAGSKSGVFGRLADESLECLADKRLGAGGGTGGGIADEPFECKKPPPDIMGGGGGGGIPAPSENVGGGGGGGGDLGEASDGTFPADCASDCLRLGLVLSPRQWGHVNFCTLGARSKRVESSRFSSNVARCTSVSVVSQMISLIGSFGSIRSKCCKMLRNGISCGVSATWPNMA